MSVLLRLRDLEDYGVTNWVTLKRWIEKEGFPAGFYLGENTRAWRKADCDSWLANRPTAGPPPEISKPAPLLQTGEAGRKPKSPLDTSKTSDSITAAQPLQKRSG
jgi:predicted DNA-binding transcriptional regulator AlpA